MDARDTQRYKRLLLAKLNELSATKGVVETPIPTAGGLGGDWGDQASLRAEAELQIFLHQPDAHLVRAIEEALGRINRDAFGVCESCRQPISKARLEAVPWTRVCRECKEQERT